MNHYAKLTVIALVSFCVGGVTFKLIPNDNIENIAQIKEEAMWSSHTNLSLMLSLLTGPSGNEEGLTEQDFKLDQNALNQLLLSNAINYENHKSSSNNEALKKSLDRAIGKIKNYVGNNPSKDCSNNDSLIVLNCELTKVIGRHNKMVSLVDKLPNITRK